MNILLSIVGIVFIATIVIRFTVWAQFGKAPSPVANDKIARSRQYNKARKRFVNLNKVEMKVPSTSLSEIFREFHSNRKYRIPRAPLPSQNCDLNTFLDDGEGMNIVWFGHSSFMIRISGKTLLFDPVFSASLFWPRLLTGRFQSPPLKLTQLPQIDYIVLTHDHFDHLNWKSIRYLCKHTQARFIAPLGVSSHLEYWGVSPRRISELDWGENVCLDTIRLHALPAQHFSGRSARSRNKTLWCSWLIEASPKEASPKTPKTGSAGDAVAKKEIVKKIFYSGDSGYSSHFKDIAAKHGPFQFCIMENGQYHQAWRSMHMHPEETIQALLDLDCKNAMTVHWGMFSLSTHSWDDPVVRSQKLANANHIALHAPMLGEVLQIKFDTKDGVGKKVEKAQQNPWWENIGTGRITAIPLYNGNPRV